MHIASHHCSVKECVEVWVVWVLFDHFTVTAMAVCGSYNANLVGQTTLVQVLTPWVWNLFIVFS